MSQPRILLVDPDKQRAQSIRDALAAVLLAQPAVREDGESAVLWAAANECDLCIMSYELPGMNGLDTLARMRNRIPNLPIVMFACSTEQHLAIAAFREGVADFVPTTGAFQKVIAERAREIIGESDPSTRPSVTAVEDPTLADVPRDRLMPTYQNRLRAIGRQLDVYSYQAITIIEVDGGFLVRGQHQRGRRVQALEFPDRDFPRLVASAIHEDTSGGEKPIHQSELVPTGYEDVLRAIGFQLDEMSAKSIVITELDEMFVIGGRGNDRIGAVPGIIPFSIFLRAEDVDLMLNKAFRRRGKARPMIGKSAPAHGGLRSLLKRLN